VSVRTTLVLAGLTALSGAAVLGTASEASSLDPFRGTLVGTAGALGEVTPSRNGKTVSSLRSGQYRLVVEDATSHSGFLLDRPNGTTIEVTSSPFVGKRTVTLTLRRGHWAYRGVVGRIHEFTVVA
jgi:hypothetical protein